MDKAKTVRLNSMIERAEKLLLELRGIYERDLDAREVSAEALNVTHEIVEKCSNILDQTMTLLFESQIAPKLAQQPNRGGYFPASHDEQSYRSALGQWNAADLDVLDAEVSQKLRSLQPFVRVENRIFARIKEVAAKKHTALLPQKRYEQERVSVTRPGAGGASWDRTGVRFGPGAYVMGVPIDTQTQMPAHSQGIDVAVQKWVSFRLEEGGEDALVFCQSAITAVRRAIETLLR